jgi:hypothetical protein
MNFLIFFIICSFTLFLDLYLIFPFLTFPNLSLLLVSLYGISNREIILKFLKNKKFNFTILKISSVFILYIFIINLVNKTDIEFALKALFTNISVIICFPIFFYFYSEKKFNLIKSIYLIMIIHFIFTIFQIFSINLTLKDLIPGNNLIGIVGDTNVINPKTLRATGAVSSPIALAHQTIAFICLTSISYFKNKNFNNFIYLLIAIILLVSTQSRAAIYSFIPLIILTNILFVKFSFKKLFLLILITTLGVLLVSNLSAQLESYFPYLFKSITSSDTHRFWTNYYISMGVLNESPLIGIPPELAWELFDNYTDPNYDPYNYDLRENVPTHHNQIFYYLRYYGLIGVLLLILLYYQIFKQIFFTKNETIKFVIGSIFVIDLFFSLTHNNKIFTAFLWIYLSLIYDEEFNLNK